MGLRSWFRRFVSKVKEVLGIYDKYDDYVAEAFFEDGSSMKYTGKPWGDNFDRFKQFANMYAYSITMNMTGSFWRFQ